MPARLCALSRKDRYSDRWRNAFGLPWSRTGIIFDYSNRDVFFEALCPFEQKHSSSLHGNDEGAFKTTFKEIARGAPV
jgi:hypothetical protein